MNFDGLTNRNAFFAQMKKVVAELIDLAAFAPRAELVKYREPFGDCAFERLLLQYDLGLRLRIVARKR